MHVRHLILQFAFVKGERRLKICAVILVFTFIMGNCWSSTKESPVASTSMAQTSVAATTSSESQKPPPTLEEATTSSESQKPPPTLEEVIRSFEALKDEADNVDKLISHIRQVLEDKKSKQDKSDKASTSSSLEKWSEWVKGGAKFLEFCSGHLEKMKQESGFNRKVVSAILDQVGHLHWAVGGLSIVAYLLQNYEKMSDNQKKCQQLLERMVTLAIHIKDIYGLIPKEDERLKKAIVLIAEGSMKCSSCMYSTKLFRFLKALVDNEDFNDLKEEINYIYNDLNLTTTIAIKKQQSMVLPLLKPSYPKNSVGLEEPVNKIREMLELDKTKEEGKAIVIYGFGGIGKTTLANAVVAKLDLEGFHYTKIIIDEDPQKNNLTSMQQQLLHDVFPEYHDRRKISLRNWEEGKDHLTQAFERQPNKPVFIFIDNALRAQDLRDLLPDDLGGLPQGSRILVTARHLSVTDLFKDRGLSRSKFQVQTLADEHAEKILCNDHVKLDDVKRILQICGGIPLALKIVSAQLSKQEYRVDSCREILKALEEGEEIKDEHLSGRLVNSVYNSLEISAQEAFLDICTVLNFQKVSRREIEYMVGVNEVATLEEAALITAAPFVNSFDDIKNGGVYWKGEEELIVHDVIRAKGRSMAKGTRIENDAESLSRAVEDQKVLQSIKGVKFNFSDKSTYVLEESQLSCMSNSVRVFGLGDCMSVTGRSSTTFEDLRFLQIGGDIPCLPVNIVALPRLAYYMGPIFKEGFSINKLPKSLRYLRARAQSNRDECATSESSNPIQTVQNSSLQELDLSQLKNLRILLEGIDQFVELKILWVLGWDEMEELPAPVCQLRSLNKLIMPLWESLKRLPESFSNLTGLTHLSLGSCGRLEGLCSSFGELRGLRYLDLYGCKMLTELPNSFGQLIALEYLALSWCTSLTILPHNFGQLTALKCLDLYGCVSLKELPLSLGEVRSLQELDLSYCVELKELPSNFAQLTNLLVLKLYGYEGEELLLSLKELRSLNVLR